MQDYLGYKVYVEDLRFYLDIYNHLTLGNRF